MALKLKITKTAFEKLSDEMKEEYNLNEDGKGYTLDVDGLEDTAALKRGKDRANQEASDLRTKLAEVEAELEDARDPKKERDIKKITTQAQEKYDKDIGERDTKIEKLANSIKKNALDTTALAMATEISKAPKVLLPHIKNGLIVELDEDFNPTVRVLGDDGKPSSKSLEGYKKELAADKDFADVMIASKASGGGSAGRKDPPNNGGAGHPRNQGEPPAPVDLSKLGPKALVAHIEAKKAAEAEA